MTALAIGMAAVAVSLILLIALTRASGQHLPSRLGSGRCWHCGIESTHPSGACDHCRNPEAPTC